MPADTYHGKPVLEHKGLPAFAELIVLWSLQAAGWEGVWIDTYSRVFRTGYWDAAPIAELPRFAASVLARIREQVGSRYGAWDVFAWSGKDVLFVELKRARHDRIRATQLRWLQAALDVGFSPKNFVIVEWSPV